MRFNPTNQTTNACGEYSKDKNPLNFLSDSLESNEPLELQASISGVRWFLRYIMHGLCMFGLLFGLADA